MHSGSCTICTVAHAPHAQKIISDPRISKESDIHHSQNNEETFEKLFAKKTCNSKIPKETNMEKNRVFSLNC